VAKKLFDLSRQEPQVMGVLNVTPDSFSDGGECFTNNKVNLDVCRRKVEVMVSLGASIIDVGGESTRPGARPLAINEEMDRVLPVVEMLKNVDVVVSLDSSSPEVMLEAAKYNIGLINDVRALQRDNALQVAAALNVPICLMHMQGQPQTMQNAPEYKSILNELQVFFSERIQRCVEAGIKKELLLLDPGFGFGKTTEHNAVLLDKLSYFKQLHLPLLVGLSRKSMISHLLDGCDVNERLTGSVVLAAMAVERGAWIVRAHDIKETVEAVKIAASVMRRANG
jgi:dihydropteroate synthase